MFSTLTFDGAQSRNDAGKTALTLQRRRAQVARACSNCRAYRIKCDNESPCRNCRRKGRICDHEDSAEVRTFARAVREIDRLNKKVQELQDLLQNASAIHNSSSSLTKARFKATTFLPANLDPLVEHGGNQTYCSSLHVETRVGTTQCYGPASIFTYMTRLNVHLGRLSAAGPAVLTSNHHVAAIADRMGMVCNTEFESNFMHMAGPINRIYMERTYEEFYLKIFWEKYHCLYPIIEEADFWDYHRSLWDISQRFRKSSAVIDIILAICLQHGTSSTHPSSRPSALADKTDEMIGSRWFYRRCQSLLTNHLETPSIMTLQAHILCVIYLSNANSQNAAHSILAIAVRTGIILGLHLEAPEGLPEQQREARKRLWWLLYAFEMKFAMELGRPLAVNISQVTCGLPSDEKFAYTTVQQKMILSKEVVYLSFSVHFVRLVLATRAIYITFYDHCAGVLGQTKQREIYERPQALEECAGFLLSKMPYSQKWLREVPDALKAGRESGGGSFSLDQSALRIDKSLPKWQQQQSVFLELHYHHMMMSLYRPFICFPPHANTVTPLVDRCAEACLDHARAMTSIIHSSLLDTKLLDNHHEAFRWQWNATLSLVGYILAYPGSPGATNAKCAVHTALQTFERLGEFFAIALLAKQTAEELLARVCNISQTKAVKEDGTISTSILPLSEPHTTAAPLELMPSQIDPLLMADYTSSSFTGSSNLLPATWNEPSDRFLFGQNLASEDFAYASFGSSAKTLLPSFGAPPVPLTWPSMGGEEEDFFRLLETSAEHGEGFGGMLDSLP